MSNQSTYRIVIKLGTNVLTADNGDLDINVIQSIVDQVSVLKKAGHRVIIVSSGAVGAGKSIYKLTSIKDDIAQRQVYSAIGQVKLMGIYANLFSKENFVCAQVLATKEDFVRGKENYKNMKNCFKGLLKDSIIPIVNENDVVSLEELMFTDNDELAGLTAYMIEADKLIILSNIEGLYTGDPANKDSKLINEVDLNDKGVFNFISSNKSSAGRGGMESKLKVATMSAEKGIETFMANGKRERVVLDILEGKKMGTRFIPNSPSV